MKKLLVLALFAVLALLVVQGASAALTVSGVSFGSSSDPIERSNPEADDNDNRVNTETTTFTISVPAGDSAATITAIAFEAGGKPKYSTSDFAMNFSLSNGCTSLPCTIDAGDSVTVTARTVVPKNIDASAEADESGDINDVDAENVGSVRVSYTQGTAQTATVPVTMFAEIKMEVDVEVIINGESYNVDDDEVEEIRPDDSVEVCVEVENTFDDNDDNIDMDVEFTLDSDDNNFEASDDSDDTDVNAGDTERVCFSMDIDNDVEDGDDFTLDLEILANDDNGADHLVTLEFDVSFESPQGEIEISSLTLDPTSVCAGDSVTLSYVLENVGTDEQNFVRAQLTESVLGVSELQSGIRISDVEERDNEYEDDFTFRVPANADDRDYRLRFSVFFEDDDGDDTSSFQDVTLTVRDCSSPSTPTTTTPPRNQTNNNNDGSIVITPGNNQNTGSVPPTTTTVVAKPVSSVDNNLLYIVGLGVLILVLVVVVIYLVVAVARK